MSTLSTTNIRTANGTTDLSISTGNTGNPGISLWSNTGRMVVGNNSQADHAVVAYSSTGYGLYGQSNTSVGGQFVSNTGTGIYVQSNTGTVASFVNATSTFMSVYGNGQVAVTGNSLALGTSSITANGYTRLPNGLLLQWGTLVCNTTSITTWPTPFTTAVYSITMSARDNTVLAGANVPYVSASGLTSANLRSSSTTTTANVYYLAIGV